ncbi:MAG: hypothetical protein LBP82_00015 [Candidatus Methanoplasma sp.]|jgi:hypothetical protein|nr:hypothetical protein [Candidatus Methanoplasma sp.]
MITEYSQIQELFVELDAHMSERTTIYMIGGGALMRWKMKPQTKDIDIVVDSEAEFDRTEDAFRAAGFKTTLPTKGYERLAISQILMRDDFRVDLFCTKVCGRLSLSEGMKERSAIDSIGAKNIYLFTCSPEDIFLFKTMTEREGDYDDCVNIINSTISNKKVFKWPVILNEAREQSKIGQEVWITWITDRLEEFTDRGLNIPILAEMIPLADEYIAEWERGLLSRNPEQA